MVELKIRPTMRFIVAGYLLSGAVLVGAIAWWISRQDSLSLAAVVGAALLDLWPMSRHLKRQRIRCKVDGAQLRYESGLVTTTVKTLQVASIQDVTVRRTLMQRLWGVGDLRIETAGKESALEIDDVDDPQAVADRIVALMPRR